MAAVEQQLPVAQRSGAIRRVKHYDSFVSYVPKLANATPGRAYVGVSSQAARAIDMIIRDLVSKIADEACKLSRDAAGRKTLEPVDVYTAAELMFPVSLGRNAVTVATKAVEDVRRGQAGRKGKGRAAK